MRWLLPFRRRARLPVQRPPSRRRWRVAATTALGLIAYLGFLVAKWPASHAWGLAEPYLPLPEALEVGALEGTVWQGRAAAVGTEQLQARRVEWELQRLPLLTGRALVAWEAALADGYAKARTVATLSRLAVEDAQGRLPAAPWSAIVARLAGDRAAALEGNLNFAVERMALDRDGQLHELDGRLAWHDAAVTVDERVELGGLTSTLAAEDGAAVGRLGDTGGPLALSGQWRLEPDGSYEVDAVTDTRQGAPDILTRSLEMAGARDDQGIHLRLEGRL